MRLGRSIRVAAIAMTLGAWPAPAQQPSERWHLQGTLGMNLSRTTQLSLLPIPGPSEGAGFDTASGDLRIGLNGFLKDPLLLPFSVDFDGLKGSNRVDGGGYRNGLLSWGVNTTFLPARPFPLRFFYRKSQFAARGNSFGQDADTSTLGLEWSLRVPKVPHLTAGYTQFNNDVRQATSLFDTSYHQGRLAVSADDTWKGWEWNTSFERYANDSNFVAGSALPSDFREDLRIFGLHVRRPFWDDKAQLVLDNRTQSRSDEFPNLGNATSGDNSTSASLRLQHTPKLVSSYFYTFVHVKALGTFAPGALPGVPGQVSLLSAPTFDSHFAGGRLEYRVTSSLRVFEEIRYLRTTPLAQNAESRESLTESLSGVSYQRAWRNFDLSGAYVGRFQLLGTNFGNRAHSFSNDLLGRVGWGDVRRIRLTGSASYSKLNLVEQLNGFSEDRHFRFEAETRRFGAFLLRFTAERSQVALLNLSGNVEQNTTGLGFQVDHARFSFSASRTLQDGAGALFPDFVRNRTLISVPLPIGQLFGTPLLDRTSRATGALLILRLRRNLDLSGNWRVERNHLTSSSIRFRQTEVRLRYRLGKFTFDLGFGSYRNESQTSTTFSGLRTNRYLLRIARDFQVF